MFTNGPTTSVAVKRTLILVVACGILACKTETQLGSSAINKAPTPYPTEPLAGFTLRGAVNLPARLLSNNGGSVIANNGGSLIAAGGGNLIAAGGGNVIANNGGSYHLTATSDVPLAGAAIIILDRNRKPVPGLPNVVTDATGHYTITGLPVGFTGLVVANASTKDGKDAHLEALATSADPVADVGLASTMVSEAGPAGGDLDPAAVKEAVALTAAALDDNALPDLGDRKGLVAKLDALAAENPALAAALARVRGVAAPTPTPTPTPVPTPTPTPPPGTIETLMEVANPAGLAIGADGAFYFAAANALVRATADGVQANLASLTGAVGGVRGIAVGSAGEVMIGDGAGSRIMKLEGNGFVVAAGTTPGFAGDGGPWLEASFQSPRRIVSDGAGGFLVADGTRRVRQLKKDGTVATIAGDGTAGVATGPMGDGGPATAAQLTAPNGLTVMGGDIYIADATANRIRRVKPDGTISTIAGTGGATSTGDGGPATAATLAQPTDLATDGTRLFILEALTARVRMVDAAGVITTYAGTTTDETPKGDGGPAQDAVLGEVRAIAVDPTGHLCILGPEAIRRVR